MDLEADPFLDYRLVPLVENRRVLQHPPLTLGSRQFSHERQVGRSVRLAGSVDHHHRDTQLLDLLQQVEQDLDAALLGGIAHTLEDGGIHPRQHRRIGVDGVDQLLCVDQIPGENGPEQQREAHGPNTSSHTRSILVQPMYGCSTSGSSTLPSSR